MDPASEPKGAFDQGQELAEFRRLVAEYGAPYYEMRRRGVSVAEALKAIHQNGEGAGPAVLVKVVVIAEQMRVGAAHDLVYESLLPDEDE